MIVSLTNSPVTRFILLCLNFLWLSCSDPYDPLPPATQVGNGTLACRINGEVWKPYTTDFLSSSKVARYLEKEKTLFIGGFNEKNSQGFDFGIANYTGQIGVYQLDSICYDLPRVCANIAEYSTSKYHEKAVTYQTSSRYKGKVEITKHTASGIVSGTFEFEAQNRITGQVVKLTEGRFDMFYQTY